MKATRLVEPESYTAEQQTAINAAVSGTRGKVPAPMRAWIQSPEFASRAQSLGELLRYHTSLSPRHSELAILVTAKIWGSRYEWQVHRKAADAAGVEPHVIEQLRQGVRPSQLDELDQVVVDVAVQLALNHQISDQLFARFLALFGRRELTELVGLLGYYTLVSMTLNVFEIDSPESNDPFFGTHALTAAASTERES